MLPNSIYKESSSSFCNSSWRNFIAGVCKRIDKNNVGFQIISPFGFELLEDKIFLSKSIKRLYCYIGIPYRNGMIFNQYEISKKFSEQLLLSMHEIGLDSSDVAVLALQERFTLFHKKNYRCCITDKLIDVQTKIISTDILHDYANYIICTVDSISSQKEEPKHFFENKRHRCRTYQLYIMLERLFAYLLPPMNVFQIENFGSIFKLIDNSIQMFYTSSELFVNATNYELHLLHSLIRPRAEHMVKAIRGSKNSDLMNLECDAYHRAGKLRLAIDKKIYRDAVNQIKLTYLNYI